MNKIDNRRAFSLIELVISLLVISLVTASFAPVMSKKFAHGKLALNAKSTKINCADKFGTDCVMCNSNSCLWCTTYINVPNGQYVDPGLGCDRKNCADKYGSTCVTCTKDYCTGCIEGYGYNSSSRTCVMCSAPNYSPGGSSVCKSCNSGYQYQDSNGASTCKTCDTANGYFPNSDRKGCTQIKCTAGQRREGSTCVNCTGNTYQSSNNYSGTSCSSCGANTAPNASKTACVAVAATPPTPTIPTCSKGSYPDTLSNTCKTCPEGCTACESATHCTECKEVNGFPYAYKFVDNFCYSSKVVKSQADCDRLAGAGLTVFIPYPSSSGVNTNYIGDCVTKFNAGDPGGPSIDNMGITILSPSVTAANVPAEAKTSDAKVCWRGANTAKSDACTSNPDGVSVVSSATKFDYAACKRTVCNYAAAQHICKNLGKGTARHIEWIPGIDHYDYLIDIINEHEPTSSGARKFVAGTSITYSQKYKGATGAQLCDSKSGHGSPRCAKGNKCRPGADSVCEPNCIWGNYVISGNKTVVHCLDGGVMSDMSPYVYRNVTNGLSVRCAFHYYYE